jgi:hypothetical protein
LDKASTLAALPGTNNSRGPRGSRCTHSSGTPLRVMPRAITSRAETPQKRHCP